MVALAALAAIVVLAQTAVIVLLMHSHRQQIASRDDVATKALAAAMQHHAEDAERWGAERRELLNRIQAPSRIRIPVPEGWAVPEDEEPDETALVGTIAPLAEDYVNDDGLGP